MADSLSDITSKIIERDIEPENPDEKSAASIVSQTETKNDEKISISKENSELHSGKNVSYREIPRLERNEENHVRGVCVPRVSNNIDILKDVDFRRTSIALTLEKDDKRDKELEVRLERELSEKIFRIYDRAEEVAKDREDLRYYSTHTMPHIICVTKTACSVGERLGLKDEKLQKEIILSAISHDMGMAGLPRDDTRPIDSKFDLLVESRNVLRPKMDTDGNIQYDKDGNVRMEDIRAYHPIASAIEVLRTSDLYEERGVNPGHIALEAILHSKSSSGTTNLDDPRDIYKQITRIDEDLRTLGLRTEKTQEIINDMRGMFNVKDDGRIEINPDRIEELNQIKSVAVAVTIGDAFSHSHGTIEEGLSQSGMLLDVRSLDTSVDLRNVDLRNYLINPDIKPCEETKGSEVYVRDPKTNKEIDSVKMDGRNDLQATFLLGELNLTYDLRSVVDRNGEQKIEVTCEIQNPKTAPASTYFAAEERIREFPRIHLYNEKNEEMKIEINFTLKEPEKLTLEEKNCLSKFYDWKIEETEAKIQSSHISINKNF